MLFRSFDDSTNIPESRSFGATSGDRYSSATDDVSDRKQFGSQTETRNDQVGGESERERQGGKPTFGDKMRGK